MWRLTTNKRKILLLCGLVILSSCSEPPGQYKLSLRETYERLVTGDFNDFKFERHCGILINIETRGQPGRAVTWDVTSSGRLMLSFTATLTPVDATTTKVDVSVSRDPDGREAYDGSRGYGRPALNQPVRPAIEEKVASLLTGRPYDAVRMNRQFAGDSICTLQRNGLEIGFCFRVDDPPDASAVDMLCRK